MKFIHLSDVHLSDNLNFDSDYSNIIRENQWKSFEKIFENNTDIDFALIAGDLFERNYFLSSDFERLFEIFKNFGKEIYYVSGNHDYIDEYNSIFFNKKPNNLNIFTSEDLSLFENGNYRIYGFSYKDRIYNKNFNYSISLDDNFYNILLCHGVLDDKSNYFSLNTDLISSVGFDYIAMGHIHRHSIKNNIFYSGSIEPLDFSHIYDYGYIRYNDGNIEFINSSLMKFYNFDIDENYFDKEVDIIKYVNDRLSNKENFVRLHYKNLGKFNIENIKNSINAIYIDIKYDNDDMNIEEYIKLYPNSLLEKFHQKFKNRNEDIYKNAYKLGVDAILRSKK